MYLPSNQPDTLAPTILSLAGKGSLFEQGVTFPIDAVVVSFSGETQGLHAKLLFLFYRHSLSFTTLTLMYAHVIVTVAALGGVHHWCVALSKAESAEVSKFAYST